jgi:hypothetical protein
MGVLASWSRSWWLVAWWLREAGVSAGKAGGASRIVLGLLYPRRLQKIYHAAGGGCRNWACQVRSWSSEEAGWTWEQWWKTGPFAHTRAYVVGVSMEPPVVGRGWSPVSSYKARGYCCRTPCRPSSRTAAEACKPGGVYVSVGTPRADPRRPGVLLAPGPQALPIQLAPIRLFFFTGDAIIQVRCKDLGQRPG